MELWPYSWTLCLPEKGLELWLYSWASVFVPEKGLKLWLYSWAFVFVIEKVLEFWLYSYIIGWTQANIYDYKLGAVFMYCYISLEVFMPYWNIELTGNHGKIQEVGQGLGLDQAKLQLRWVRSISNSLTVAWVVFCAYARNTCKCKKHQQHHYHVCHYYSNTCCAWLPG